MSSFSLKRKPSYKDGALNPIFSVTNETQLMLGFVAAGMGIALLPNSIRRLRRDGVVYRSVEPSTAEIVERDRMAHY
ncbi:MAG: hypothetical protein F6K26_36920 [Moorea sp. SIO2I5]|nr:hypothetical protein [Moorena sp. SIO2I5]